MRARKPRRFSRASILRRLGTEGWFSEAVLHACGVTPDYCKLLELTKVVLVYDAEEDQQGRFFKVGTIAEERLAAVLRQARAVLDERSGEVEPHDRPSGTAPSVPARL